MEIPEPITKCSFRINSFRSHHSKI